MLSKSKIKLIRSLEQKKYRVRHGLFVAEGPKTVEDLSVKFQCRYFCATEEWAEAAYQEFAGVEHDVVTSDELRRVSFLEHPQQVLALFDIPATMDIPAVNTDTLSLALDGIQNPGNIGTIVRIADWFGIKDIFCSESTADVFNPKTVQATMGSLARVNVTYTDLPALIASLPGSFHVFGTFLDGRNIYTTDKPSAGLVVMGNEGRGITPDVEALVTDRITIPNFNTAPTHADSLNVAVATASVTSEFRRASL